MAHRDREARLREEVQHHLDLATADNIQKGMNEADARRSARMAFGPTESFKDEARDAYRSRTVAMLRQDIRHAGRAVRRAPMLAIVVIVTLSVAFALATSAFTVVNGVLFRTLPYPEPDRLAVVWGTSQNRDERGPVSFTNASDWRRDVHTFALLAMFGCTPRPILGGPGDPARASMMEVSRDFFPVLRGHPALGRLFDSTDFVEGAAPTVVLTDQLWRTRFGARPAAVNSALILDGAPVTIIGILPPAFHGMPAGLACTPDLYRPLSARYNDGERSWTFLHAVGRFTPSATPAQAQADLDLESSRLAALHPATNQGRGAAVELLGDHLTRPIRPALLFVQAGALLVLLVATANVTNLLLARATVRRREFAVRVALGASRPRIARQIATECLMLGGLSAMLGTALTIPVTAAIARVAGDSLPSTGFAPDWRVLAFVVAVTIGVTLAFAAATIAATAGEGGDTFHALREGGRGGSGRRSPLRRALVVLQLALAMIIMVGAGLLARSYHRVLDVQPGFESSGVLTARVTLPDATYPRGAPQVAFFRQVTDRIAALPGVTAVGAASVLPESADFDHAQVKVIGREYVPGTEPMPDVYRVTPGYFDALRIARRSGRLFTSLDDDQHPPVALINETMARTLFPAEDAVGRRIWTGAGNTERTIVGVVADVYQYGLDSTRTMQLYVPHAENSGGDLTIVVRGTADPLTLIAGVRSVIHAADPGVPVEALRTMDQVLATSAARRRLLADLSLLFAAGAIALAAIGLYGVMAYSVAQRTREIGVRMALGATTRAILFDVVMDAGRLVLIGLATGLVLAALLARAMASLLFHVGSIDTVTFLLAPVLLLIVAVVASTIPAARSARVSPLVALREE